MCPSRELNPLIGVTTGSISQRAGIRRATADPVCRTGGQCRLATQLFDYRSPHVPRRARLLGSSKSSFSEIKNDRSRCSRAPENRRGGARRTVVLFEGGTRRFESLFLHRRLSFTHRADSVASRFLLCLKGGALALRKGVPWDGGSSLGPVSPVARGKREVIVILTNRALIDRISPDRRRIKVFQNDISAVPANKIVAAGARHSPFCTKN